MGKEIDILNKGQHNASTNSSSSKSNPMNDMSISILRLCQKLSQNVTGDNFDCADWLNELERYIANGENRLLYSDISNYILV